MKKFGLFYLFVSLFIASCSGPSADEQLELINKSEKELYAIKDQFDYAKADALIRNYDLFATSHPEHEMAATFLFRAGDLSTGMTKSLQAIGFFDRIEKDYPDFEKAPDALFLKAFVYENQLKDYELAEQYYREFIKQYPDHAMAQSAEFSIQNIGIPAEELIKRFEEKAKTDTNLVP